MRVALVVAFLVNITLVLVSWSLCPDRVAIHFGPGGQPDNWAPAYVNALIMLAVHSLMFVLFLWSTRLVRRIPIRFVNIPNRAYWGQDENRLEMEKRLSSAMLSMGVATFALLFCVGLLALQANLSTPVQLRQNLLWTPLGLYIAYVVYWSVRLNMAFRCK